MVSCIYHTLMLWQDVFFNHASNQFPLGAMDVPLWTLSALAFIASLYAFLLLLDETCVAPSCQRYLQPNG
jgi:hypothetical protein